MKNLRKHGAAMSVYMKAETAANIAFVNSGFIANFNCIISINNKSVKLLEHEIPLLHKCFLRYMPL